MSKRLDKFTKPFQGSRIPFLLVEVVTDGTGQMVDLLFRYVNFPAAVLVGLPADTLQGQRFTHLFPADRLSALRPFQAVAFSGSAAFFPYTTLLGHEMTITCYQPMYGLVACILDSPWAESSPAESGTALVENLPGAVAVLELSRSGVQFLSFNQRLCNLCHWSRKELLDRSAGDFASLVAPADWPDLLQELLDAGRDGRDANRDFRLLRGSGDPLWVNLRAKVLSVRNGIRTFYAILLDIDQQRRAQLRFAETLRQLETARQQLSQLFDSLPVGCCLLQVPFGDGSAVPLHVSRGLSELFGYSAQEFLQDLTADPLGRIYPADREALSAEARQARETGAPLQSVCRAYSKAGSILWISIKVVWQPQPDGSTLLYIACSDVTREKEAELDLQIQSRLCGLLLEHSRTVSFNYDLKTDTAYLDFFAGGRRSTRTVHGYLDDLKTSAFVHPEDRRALAASVRRAVNRPGTETLEYRGDYDGSGWRWYQISWESLFDGRGDVYRLLGKAEDITSHKAAEVRFRNLIQHQKRLSKQALLSFRLDLSANQMMDCHARSSRLNAAFSGSAADVCLCSIASRLPVPAEREQFQALFQRDALLNAFRCGTIHFGQEHLFAPEGTGRIWARTMLDLAEDPVSLHLTAFCCILDVDESCQQSMLLQTLLQRDYEFVLTVDVASGRCRAHGRNRETLPSSSTYRGLLATYICAQTPSRERAAIRKAMRLETVTAALENTECYQYQCAPESESGQRASCLRWSWLDRERGLLLLTVSRDG
ncbi:PAS domain S-box-containing protein [Oscillibacter sp. PC13]|uniref:PAS domain-containing protein n=1 Tax=Oscillibacter sp. PC13 TaxID=1855299 RepID=UPI0008ECF838|nr:PAS domain-containing protein [Oscillibacter sp. PC13]SFP48632.1 PAS domain S-box-containing protein [Oscillibacter sp. PC13]